MSTPLNAWLHRRVGDLSSPELAHASGVSRHAIRRLRAGAAWKVDQLGGVLDACGCDLIIRHRGTGDEWTLQALPDMELVVELTGFGAEPSDTEPPTSDPQMRARVEVLLACVRAGMQPLRLQAVLRALGLDRKALATHPDVSGVELLELVRARAFSDIGPAVAPNCEASP